jgi:hypothetical protein
MSEQQSLLAKLGASSWSGGWLQAGERRAFTSAMDAHQRFEET